MGRIFDGIHRRSVLVDPNGNVAKVYLKVKPKTHAEQVLADLHELQGLAE
jgi:peroxiredoxin Q/BCP